MSNIKEDLIKIATNTIQKSGIHKLTIRDLGAAVNIKSSSVMYHFKSKDGLMFELVKIYNENFFNHLDSINKSTDNVNVRLNKLVDIFEAVLLEDKLCLCGMLASENENLDLATKNQVKYFFEKLNKWVEDNLALINIDKNISKVIVSSLEGGMLVDNLSCKEENLRAIRVWINSFKKEI